MCLREALNQRQSGGPRIPRPSSDRGSCSIGSSPCSNWMQPTLLERPMQVFLHRCFDWVPLAGERDAGNTGRGVAPLAKLKMNLVTDPRTQCTKMQHGGSKAAPGFSAEDSRFGTGLKPSKQETLRLRFPTNGAGTQTTRRAGQRPGTVFQGEPFAFHLFRVNPSG